MNLKQINSIVNGTIINNKKLTKINKIKIDSKKVNKNDIFICIKGNNKDGHDYIEDVINKCSLIIVEKNINITTNTPIIKVENTIIALQLLSKFIKEKYNPYTIAITGSVGKTTTKNLIYKILKNKYNVITNEKNYNGQIGVPLTILNLNKNIDILLVEVGISQKNEMDRLSNIITPDMALITNIGSSHIGNFKTKKNILNNKLKITKYMKDGILIVNSSDKYLNKLKNKTNYYIDYINYKYFKVKNINIHLDKMEFDIYINNKMYKIVTKLIGKHFIIDILFAIEIGLLFDIEIDDIIKSVESYIGNEHRLNIIKNNNYTIIDDTYNSSFESVTSLIDLTKNIKNKIYIIGDIKELGVHSIKYHKKINNILKKIKDKEVIVTGEYTKYISGIHFNNNSEIINYLKNSDLDNKTIILKASHCLKFDEIVKYLNKIVRL